MSAFNGFINYNAWNVNLWIANDEPLYRLALDCLRRCNTQGPNRKPRRGYQLDHAARMFRDILHQQHRDTTPDGVPFTQTNVRHALANLTE